MALPPQLERRLRIPAMAAPMFLVSGPALVIEACKAGMLGAFPALNQRTSKGYGEWLAEIGAALAGTDAAPFAVNLVSHGSNLRLQDDLRVTVQHRVPVVITTLLPSPQIVDAVHAYGGLVFHDVITLRHAEKAIASGVDGVVAVCAGAGGHAGTYNPFAFVAELRPILGGKALILAGAIGNGQSIVAALACGADLASLGTRFIASRESMAADAYKGMVCQAQTKDIIYTAKITGLAASFLRASLESAGIDPAAMSGDQAFDIAADLKAWKELWSAGQGVGGIAEVLSVRELCDQLEREFHSSVQRLRRVLRPAPTPG